MRRSVGLCAQVMDDLLQSLSAYPLGSIEKG